MKNKTYTKELEWPSIQDIQPENEVRISGDTLSVNLDRLINEGKISPEEKDLITWFFTDAKEKRLNYGDTGKLINYDASTISRVFNGRYTGSYERVIKAIEKYRHISTERQKMSSLDFIETSIWEQIRQTCDLALINQMPAMIMGISQIGKTHALLEYKTRSSYTIRYVRMPAAASFRTAVEAVADACSVPTGCASDTLRRRIIKSLDNRSLLIIDELHQLAISTGKQAAMKVMEWIREVHDVSGCGWVVCGTRAMEQDLIQGDLKGWLEQFRERFVRRLELPNILPDADILLVCKTYGLGKPDDDTRRILKTLRMNRLCKMLALSQNLANNLGQPLDWAHFNDAYRRITR